MQAFLHPNLALWKETAEIRELFQTSASGLQVAQVHEQSALIIFD